MPWQQEATKGVAACDKPRGDGEQSVIRGCPNGKTHPSVMADILTQVGRLDLGN